MYTSLLLERVNSLIIIALVDRKDKWSYSLEVPVFNQLIYIVLDNVVGKL